jgi:hypothetical protein
MAIIDNLWLAALTKDEDDAGSDSRFNLTVNIDGIDVVVRDFDIGWRLQGTGGGQVELRTGLLDGQAGLENSKPLDVPFDSAGLTQSSIRLGIRGDDAWAAEHVLLIGRTQPSFTPGQIVALAMETEISSWLSSDNDEGHLTMRLRLVSPGSSATLIQRVLLLIYTDSGDDVETENSIELQIGAGGGIVMSKTITDDLNQLTAHWYFLDVETPFTQADMVTNGSIRLRILGADAWLPKTVFVFGLDTASGRPGEVVTLASVPDWDLGWLSTDPSEGSPSVLLPLHI